MAAIKGTFSTPTAFTITGLNSMGSSATAGWATDYVDNGTTLYTDAVVTLQLAAVNTAPGALKAAFVYAYGLTDPGGSIFTGTGAGNPSGTNGSLTFPDVTAYPVNLPLIGVANFSATNFEVRVGPFSVANNPVFRGILPQRWGIAIINQVNFAFAASGNSLMWSGVYRTVA